MGARSILVTLVGLYASFLELSLANAQDQDVQVIEPPLVTYPWLASWLGIEGYCEVVFAVDVSGYVVAPQAACTRPIFCSSAEKAVTTARFSPALSQGIPFVRYDIVYPLEYRFESSDYESQTDPSPLEACEEIAIF